MVRPGPSYCHREDHGNCDAVWAEETYPFLDRDFEIALPYHLDGVVDLVNTFFDAFYCHFQTLGSYRRLRDPETLKVGERLSFGKRDAQMHGYDLGNEAKKLSTHKRESAFSRVVAEKGCASSSFASAAENMCFDDPGQTEREACENERANERVIRAFCAEAYGNEMVNASRSGPCEGSQTDLIY